MLNCRDLTRLVSESFERKLTLSERMNLWMHIGMCGTCRKFRRLQTQIHDAVRLWSMDLSEPTAGLSQESYERLTNAVTSEMLKSHNPDRADF